MSINWYIAIHNEMLATALWAWLREKGPLYKLIDNPPAFYYWQLVQARAGMAQQTFQVRAFEFKTDPYALRLPRWYFSLN